MLKEYQRQNPRATDYLSILSLLCEILHTADLLSAGLEHSRSNLVFVIRKNYILECSIDGVIGLGTRMLNAIYEVPIRILLIVVNLNKATHILG